VKDGKQFIGEDIPSPSMVKGGKGSPWARKGKWAQRKEKNACFFWDMCECVKKM
jgi:hypothetical protein